MTSSNCRSSVPRWIGFSAYDKILVSAVTYIGSWYGTSVRLTMDRWFDEWSLSSSPAAAQDITQTVDPSSSLCRTLHISMEIPRKGPADCCFSTKTPVRLRADGGPIRGMLRSTYSLIGEAARQFVLRTRTNRCRFGFSPRTRRGWYLSLGYTSGVTKPSAVADLRMFRIRASIISYTICELLEHSNTRRE